MKSKAREYLEKAERFKNYPLIYLNDAIHALDIAKEEYKEEYEKEINILTEKLLKWDIIACNTKIELDKYKSMWEELKDINWFDILNVPFRMIELEQKYLKTP